MILLFTKQVIKFVIIGLYRQAQGLGFFLF
jgi:hypothetical protein